MNAKEIDQQACNINAVGCAMLRKNFIPHDATALPRSRPRVDKVQRRGRMVVTKRTHSGHMAMVDIARQTQEARTGGQGLEARKAVTWLTCVMHGTDPRRTCGGHKADKVWRCGHKADTWRTSSGDAARAYRSQPFFLRENPTVNCLGNQVFNILISNIYRFNF